MFSNAALSDFSIDSERNKLKHALERVDQKIKKQELRCFPIINGYELKTPTVYERWDPSEKTCLVGKVHFASLEHVRQALECATRAQPAWAAVAAEKRAEIIKRVSELMRNNWHDLSALILREAGKPWREADADVAEAVDFCDYYADQALLLDKPRKTMEVPGEDNIYLYEPRGVCVVISPWNFPLAIACGMSVAALVTGNSLILKPAEQTSLIAYHFAKILLQAGVPTEVVSFLPGVGEEIGRALVESPKVDMICFTGSKNVGLEILRTAAEVRPGQRNVKKVVAEMGGKNAIIVDSDADLDETLKGVLYSAFGFSGQKCSACSRLIVVEELYEALLKRLSQAASDVIVGKASEPATLVGPVIDQEAQTRIKSVIETASKTVKIAASAPVPQDGYFVSPTIFRDVARSDSLWREEIFGPVLAVTRAKDFEEALQFANDSQYALTGGVFSRNPKHIELAKCAFKVGNLYINRGCTGALVCRQPFGGSRMSGVGSKAGGPDYLLQFLEPRTITENTLRRGFTPESV